ncbi:MAG: sirohydrochlorin chelatase [Cuspidothrix sp.]
MQHNNTAYLLVSHGSSDPRPDVAMQQLAQLIREKLPQGENLVGFATLEANVQPLHLQIQDFAHRVQVVGCKILEIIPLFLLPGVHVMTDIPTEIALAKQVIDGGMTIKLHPYIGSYPHLEKFVARMITTIKSDISILLAHGSRRPGSHTPIENIAANVGAVTAYWSVDPSLEARVQELIASGYQQIVIFPYFLFRGGITDAIAQATERLKLQFPSVTFQLAQPLGTSREFADLIWDFIQQEENVFG